MRDLLSSKQLVFPSVTSVLLLLLRSSSLIHAQEDDDKEEEDDDEPTSSTAQVSAAFTEPATGLAMERFFGARTTFGFAMTMPATPTDSFIGQLSFPLVDGAGWGALGLNGDMENNFFLAAWADGAGGVMASFRQGTDEEDPPEVVGAFSVRPLAAATAANDSFLTFTFLCEGCLDSALGLGAEAVGADGIMGWALSEEVIANPETPAGRLGFHERGFGPFTMRLGEARSADFDAVAATAGDPIAASAEAVEVTLNVAGTEADSEDEDEDEEEEDDD